VKIVITGGSGFIGTYLARRLLKDGHEVIIADIKEPRDGKLRRYWKYCDVTDLFQLDTLLKDCDVVFHLAANPEPRIATINPRWDLKINVIGTLNVIDLAVKYRCRMIFTSTAQIKYAPDSHYAISKRTAEKYILSAVKKRKLNASIVRFWNVYGPGQRLGFVIPDFIEKLRRNPNVLHIRGTGLDVRDFVYITDAVEALITVMEKGEVGEIYEVGTNHQLTIYELGLLIGQLMYGFKPVILTDAEPPVNWERKEIKEDNKIRKLGWKPKVSLEEGLLKVITGEDHYQVNSPEDGGN